MLYRQERYKGLVRLAREYLKFFVPKWNGGACLLRMRRQIPLQEAGLAEDAQVRLLEVPDIREDLRHIGS